MDNPHKYTAQLPPGPAIPVTMSIVGPPKSGKTTGITKHLTDSISNYQFLLLSCQEILFGIWLYSFINWGSITQNYYEVSPVKVDRTY